jgi:RNase H-like domain found in reverse transcriptase
LGDRAGYCLRGSAKLPIVLRIPNPKWDRVLDTDASGTAIGAVLQQKNPLGGYHVIAYASKLLPEAQRK